jgi:hypothetical protein
MEGYILKWINFIKGWTPRYMIFEEKENRISINNKKNETKKKWKFIEIKYTTSILEDKKNKFSIKNEGNKIIYFKTKTKEEKDNWIQIINKAINIQIQNKEKEKIDMLESKFYKSEENDDNCDKESILKGNKLEKNKDNTNKNTNSNKNKNPTSKEKKIFFSKNFYIFEDLLNKEYKESSMNNLDQVIYSFKNLQNLFFEFNNNVENFRDILNKEDNKIKEIMQIFDSFDNLKNEIKVKTFYYPILF